jgi:hypothetical protein
MTRNITLANITYNQYMLENKGSSVDGSFGQAETGSSPNVD